MKEILVQRCKDLLPELKGEERVQNKTIFETYCLNIRLLKELFPDEYAKFTEKR